MELESTMLNDFRMQNYEDLMQKHQHPVHIKQDRYKIEIQVHKI